LNGIFVFLIAASVLFAAFSGNMAAVTAAGIDSARSAVEVTLSLLGQMALWLGFLAVLQAAGMLRSLARLLTPVMRRLFPGVPADHPAMGAMILNLTANMLGLGNAATPFGLKAIRELNRLNPYPGVATNAMALFLAINTAGLQLLPLTAMAVRGSVGSKDPAGIVGPSLLASLAGTVVAVAVARLLQGRRLFAARPLDGGATVSAIATGADGAQGAAPSGPPAGDISGMSEAEAAARQVRPATGLRLWFGVALMGLLVVALIRHLVTAEGSAPLGLVQGVLSDWLVPAVMLGIVAVGFGRRVHVYERAVEGAKEALQVGLSVFPFLVLLLVAIGMFRASGAMEGLVGLVQPWIGALGIPAEALPMALMRSFSGSGSLAIMTETMKVHGPDSFLGYLVSTIYGSSETTFYVLAVYFGSVQVRATRHTLAACLAADAAGVIAAVAVCNLFFGG